MKKSLPHKVLSNIIRFPFGNSNRSGHLRMSRCAAAIACLSMFYHTQDPILSIICAIGCIHMEAWASADRDQAEKGYWALYDSWFKHRSFWSHSLVVGTGIRLLYGYWGAPFMMLWLAPPIGVAWIAGALTNDLGHLILDI